jgi:hypothetical protein
MSKKDFRHEITHRDHDTKFPWRWLGFFVICLFGGGEGVAFFILVLLFVKGFTKIIRF